MRKILPIVLSVLMMASLAVPTYADGHTILVLSELTEEECIEFLVDQGCEIPEELHEYENLGIFVKNIITQVENNPNYPITFNYQVTHDFAENIKKIVNEYYGRNTDTVVEPRYTLELTDSISQTDTWDESYSTYNCYAYSIGSSGWPYPGYYSGRNFSISYSVDSMATLTAADLKARGYECISYGASYSSILALSSSHKIICLRKCTQAGLEDFHYMKCNGYWYHKPGKSTILLYKNYYPYTKNWTNEGLFRTGVFEGDRYYNSTIYYFAYRSSHTYSDTYTGENYHSGNLHYYQHEYVCSGCGDTYYAWNSISCSGPPCPDYAPLSIKEVALETE